MEVSKTKFKEYCKCSSFYNLENIYYKHVLTSEKEENVQKVLNMMFDIYGDDLIKVNDETINTMLPYYKEVEKKALEEASKTFNQNFEYFENNTKQKKIVLKDINGIDLYTYLDGFSENETRKIIIEVKATTSNKFLKLGYTEKKIFHPLFIKENNIIKLKPNLEKNDVKVLEKVYNKYTEVGKYFYDIAITKYINSNISNPLDTTKYYLAILNSDYIKNDNNENSKDTINEEKLITFIDCDEIVKGYKELISKDLEEVINNINQKGIVKDKFTKNCLNCIFKDICFPFLKDSKTCNTLLSPKKVKNISFQDLINNNIFYIKDIPLEYFEKPNHLIQRNCICNNRDYFDENKIANEINKLEYPIYHLDFEAFQSPIPRFNGEKPYTQSVFQYSIHIERSIGVCDRIKDNYYYLPKDFLDHRKDLIENMIKTIDLSKGGTVMVYNAAFEKTRIKELIDIFPEYKNELENINKHMYDLMDIVRGSGDKVNYYHPDLNGSYSIKKVLPIFSDLSYKELEIKNGVEAVSVYAKFKDSCESDITALRDNLIKYCGLDTYSMHIILNGFIRRLYNDRK